MAWQPLNPLVFMWWNTSLSPPIPTLKSTSEDADFVVAQVREMRQRSRFAVLGLAEVQSSNLDAILNGLGDPDLLCLDSSDRTQRLMHDTALIYDQSVLTCVDRRSFVERFGKHQMKLGQLTVFETKQGAVPISVVTSHWPSRRSAPEHAGRKAEFGTLLRKSLEQFRDPKLNPYIVLMGDYNDDPFSPSLAEHLLATRDRELARRNPQFFYNPFWRWLGESQSSAIVGADHSVCGTHFYPNGDQTEWFTYDQIIFSSAFLADGTIILDEESTAILTSTELKGRLHSRAHTCDHLPVRSSAMLRKLS